MDIDGSSNFLATGATDAAVRVWDLDKGFCTHNFRGHRGIVKTVKFHPDPHRWQLVSAAEGDSQIRVWDLISKTCTAVLDGHYSVVTSFAFSACGWTLLSGGRDKVVNVWNLRTNVLERTIPVFEVRFRILSFEVESSYLARRPSRQ